MNNKELDFILQEGEGLKLEFKESLNNLDKEIVAFSNSEGGRILLGVTDDGIKKGIEITNKLKSEIHDIANNIDPKIKIKLEVYEDILIIHVEEGKDKPYKCSSGFYLRQGPNSQKMKRDEIIEFITDVGKIKFDEIINKDFDLKRDFDDYKFKNFLKLAKITGNNDRKIILKNLGLLQNGYLTNAGILMFCHRISKFFLQGKVTCVLFEGTSSNIIDKKEFDADLISNYENAYNFIISKLNTKFIIKDIKREEKLELPKDAIREALMNAFAHRDYFSTGHVQINIFIDRVEINNPGGLVKGLDEKDLGEVSIPRNPLLFDLLSRTHYVEKAGTGIKRIKDAMKEYDLKVDFRSTGIFKVVFYREKLVDQPKTSQKPAKEERKKLIIEAIKEKKFTKRVFAEELGVNRSTVESDLEELKKEGKIDFIGPAKGGHWKILK